MKKKDLKAAFVDEKDSQYREYHVTDAWGGLTPHGEFQMTLYDTYPREFDDSAKAGELTIVRKKKCRVTMSPAVLKKMAKWMSEKADAIGHKGEKAGQAKPTTESDAGKAYA